MTFEPPVDPHEPWDGRKLTDKQLLGLAPRQAAWAELTARQWDVLAATPVTYRRRPPVEMSPDRIPNPSDQAKIKRIFDWVDQMSTKVRQPQGMAWVEIHLMMASLGHLMDWSNSDPPINPHYRYRIDTPMDVHPEVPDTIPEEW